MTKLRERDIEKYLREEVKKIGGKAYKFESPGNNGVPDRLVIIPQGRIYFVELKAPKKAHSALQQRRQMEMSALGAQVYTNVDSKAKVTHLIAQWGENEI